jgi:formate hydrogenlyase subunit 3/multisubunit Na+/H+ antiporter MnhD subunit
MSAEEIENYAMIIGVSVLIGFMFFIMWDLAKKSNAGKFGTIIIFTVLGLGIFGFLIKTIIVEMMDM